MKKIGIITLTGNNNYGNKLQNYALQEYLKKLHFQVNTIKNYGYSNGKKKYIYHQIRHFIGKIKSELFHKKGKEEKLRQNYFIEFNKYIEYDEKIINAVNAKKFNYDYFIVGSDQVWNPSYYGLRDIDLLAFAMPNKRISYAASFGVSNIDGVDKEFIKGEFEKFKALSVREDMGKELIEGLTHRNDVEVVIDPTMLLNDKDYDKIIKKPEKLNSSKYILNYFLGELSEDKKREINRIAKENNCDIINILDKNEPLYMSGPSEFLYLEKNAFLICTDSFHSCVFSILFNRPFIVFDRDDREQKMTSRIDTLINKFNLKDRRYNEKNITRENLQHDYSDAYRILKEERNKSEKFLKKALGIEE